MKCAELKAGNLRVSALFLPECGGIYLQDGQSILVIRDVSDRMLMQYKGRLVHVKDVEFKTLKNGHYQLLPHQKKAIEQKTQEIHEAPVKEVSSDKSMSRTDAKARIK